MKINRTVLLALLIVNAAGCGAAVETAKNRQISNTTNAAVATAATPVNSKSKIGRGVGVVLSVDAQNSTVELKHGDIPGMMPAMEMMFDVRDKTQLQNLKSGDKVEFTLEENENREEKIVQIAPLK